MHGGEVGQAFDQHLVANILVDVSFVQVLLGLVRCCEQVRKGHRYPRHCGDAVSNVAGDAFSVFFDSFDDDVSQLDGYLVQKIGRRFLPRVRSRVVLLAFSASWSLLSFAPWR